MRNLFYGIFAFFFILSMSIISGADNKTYTTKSNFFTIGTGDVTGIYYPTGGAIAKIINTKCSGYGIQFGVESTLGSVYNVDAVLTGDLDFGVVQSDRQYQAVHGLAEWKKKGPQKDLRAIFSIHPESVTLVATLDSGIKSMQDLKGKRVNIGNIGSGHRQNAIDALKAAGISYTNDLKAEDAKMSDAIDLLRNKKIDAFFYTVGHPSEAFKEATSCDIKVSFIPITGSGIEKLIKETPYYTKAFVPIKHYPTASNSKDIETFGVKGTFVTSAKMPGELVYVVTKCIFENLEEFKTLHPAYESLTKNNMLEGMSAQIHPGAMTYYKEIGLIK